jgi:V8-like Glu-specific endopeptidase
VKYNPSAPDSLARSFRDKFRLVMLALFAVTSLLMMVNPAGASAAPNDESTDPPNGHYIDKQEAQKAVDYWTPERMAAATPSEPSVDTLSASKTTSHMYAAQTASPLETLSEPLEAVPWSDPSIEPAVPVLPEGASLTNGKVYFQEWAADEHGDFEWRNFTCSGSAVNSPSKSVFVTAAHCVHTGGPDGTWSRYMTFYPGYNEGLAPRHTYPATSFQASEAWLTEESTFPRHDPDIAFVSTDTNPLGERLVDRVGGHGLQIGGDFSFGAQVFGYPGNKTNPNPYNGETQEICAGTTETYTNANHTFLALNDCDIKEGGSGGPWLDQYDSSTGLGYVRSVLSFRDTEVDGVIHAPYLTEEIKALFQAADEYENPWNQ